jgi:filamentous hemagglutinin family protein
MLLLALGCATHALANPSGLTVRSGSATVQSTGSQLTVTTGALTLLNWSSFNIQNGETTTFVQPSANSVVFNIIGGANPSQIFGNLNANGTVVLANAHGFYFGPNSFVNVGGNFVATTAPLPSDPGLGAGWEFTGTPPLASIVNYGQISTGQGHSLYLIAEDVENHGGLAAPGGNVGLCAGQDVLLAEQADGRGLSATVKLPAGSVDNSGRIIADAGTIALNAQVVNQNGVIQANSVLEKNGTIELVASDQLNLGPNSQILARGDGSAPGSPGGSATLKSGNTFVDSVGSQIITTGGAQGGNGGNVEVSAPNMLSLNSSMNAGAQPGSTGGELSLDPENITLSSSGTSLAASSGGTVLESSAPTAGTLMLNVSSLNSFSTIDLQASQNITLSTSWTVPATSPMTTLTLEAGNNIIFNSGDSLKVQNNASVNLLAGVNNFNSTTYNYSIVTANPAENLTANPPVIVSSITFSGNASLQSANGNISLIAGNGISTGSGSIESTGGGNILLQALSQNIALGSGTWTLPYSGSSGLESLATFQSGVSITVGGSILAGQNWNLDLIAGANNSSFSSPPTIISPPTSASVMSGTGSVTLSGKASLQTENGDIGIVAGNNVTVGSGNICTTGVSVNGTTVITGGNINVVAASGSINAGTDNSGYTFTPYEVSASPGGIATAAGGNVTLTAGQSIISSPNVPSGSPPGGSGAYGSEPGKVNLSAGNQILGNYVEANGAGTIYAGVTVQNGQVTPNLNPLYPTPNVGSATSAVELSLISGSWNVWAANNIYIQEVLNPNGSFGFTKIAVPAGEFPGDVGNPTVPTGSAYLFNYAPNAAANFWAGNGITLTGINLPQASAPNQGPIYPPILTLNAGAGGISIENSIILFPSSQGTLQITTRDGGDLTGEYKGSAYGITMSDSGLPGWNDFATGQAVTPLHISDPNPVVADVSGDIDSFNLTVPTFAQITVAGSANNFNFTGQNVSPSQTTAINVTGDISYRSDVTSVPLATPLPAALFKPLPATLLNDEGSDPALANLQNVAENIQYNAATGVLSFHGVMTSAEETFLLNPYELELNSSGKPVFGANGLPLTEPLTLTAAQQAAIAAAIPQLYTASQTATLGATGLGLAGPGHFEVTAGNINLGSSDGIQVLEGDSALTAISPYGANLTINTSGYLDMTYSKVANEGLLGGVQLNIGSTLDVGSESNPFSNPNAAVGIFTTSGGGISITATGDVDVNGSRVAAYDGGNINIRSTTGDVDAGTGGTGNVSLQGVYLNSQTGQLVSFDDSIPGSGIMATSLPHAPAPLGNIVIDTPEGSINASKGGILQIALNGANSQDSSITLNAGKDINATGSGIIGANLQLTAGDSVNGVLVSIGTINVAAAVNANVTAFAKGDVTISAGGDVTGTVMTSGSASVSGESITASLISASVSTSGSTTGSAIGVPQSNVSKEDSKVADDASTLAAMANETDSDDDKKNKNKTITLAQKSGRVTVILPGKKTPPHS